VRGEPLMRNRWITLALLIGASGCFPESNSLTASVCEDADGDGVPGPGPGCPSGAEVDCDDNSSARAPGKAEVCDGIDNDCNDRIDDGYRIGEDCTSGAGACAAAGKTICDGLEAVKCDSVATEPGERELCGNLIDDDCDGELDEGFEDLGKACTRKDFPCSGVWVCGETALVCMTGFEPTADEVCDGLDNNCDGDIDEGFDVGAACNVGIGECRAAGTFVCDGDGNGVVCSADPGESQAELCDELDNDCDGDSDEDFPLETDEANCGVCGRACGDGELCCGGACVEYLVDESHCGGCGVLCSLPHGSEECVAGVCEVDECDDAWDDCTGAPGCETQVTNSNEHCGGCGNACVSDGVTVAACIRGECEAIVCLEGRADCDRDFDNGCEANLDDDDSNCGRCGVVCQGENATASCSTGVCTLECEDGFGDCDNVWQSGCEDDLLSDLNHCGECGASCSVPNAAVTCESGSCVTGDCAFGFWDLTEEPGCEYGPCVISNAGEEVCDGLDNDCNGEYDEGIEGPPCAYARIEPGTFLMGAGEDEPGFEQREGPIHEVEITRPFALKRTEVTQEEWVAVMDSNPAFNSLCPTCPVERVSWWDSVFFANAISEANGLEACYEMTNCTGVPGTGCEEGRHGCESDFECDTIVFSGLDCTGFRLPTEAEWEYAARAGTETSYYAGAATQAECDPIDPILNSIGWYCGNSGITTHPVGLKTANAWGLPDLSGNVNEWVWDRASSDYYTFSPAVDPLGPGTGQNRGRRGGSHQNDALWARSGARPPGGDIDGRTDGQGLRLARTLVR
jgi:formylglycine-generating enzyme required for sulfatase activity